jgi:hypothetical protein
MEKRSNRRGGFITSQLVEPYKQVRLGLVFLFINLLFSLLIMAVYGYYIQDVYSSVSVLFNLSAMPEEQTSAVMGKFMLPILVGVGILVSFILTTLYVSISYTHRIYGPLVSIRRFLDELLAGEIPKPVQLRHGDHLQDLVQRLNNIAERMSLDQQASAMVAIHRFVDELTAGKKPELLQLRKGDQLHDLATKLNQLAQRTEN